VWVARSNSASVIRFDQSLIVVVVIIRCRCFITTRWAYIRALCGRRRRRRRTATGRCPSGPGDRRYSGGGYRDVLYVILCLHLSFNSSSNAALGHERDPLMSIAEGALRALTCLRIALHASNYVHVIYNAYCLRVSMRVHGLLL